jgi:transcriptional regulator with XRE-family HTH domain
MTEQSTVAINGAALRVIRLRTGLGLRELAVAADISHPYLSLLETGGRQQVSPAVFDRLCVRLKITDRTALLASPKTTEAVA